VNQLEQRLAVKFFVAFESLVGGGETELGSNLSHRHGGQFVLVLFSIGGIRLLSWKFGVSFFFSFVAVFSRVERWFVFGARIRLACHALHGRAATRTLI